ncbi:MAG: PPC domain-containing DNA-binding protein [Candidatus Firestonebacteria bacterium]
MKYSEGKINRVFVIRLEDKDKLPDVIESFCQKNKILRAMCILVGGINTGGKLVVGPKNGLQMPPEPLSYTLKGVHEISAVGTIFPDSKGKPRLHMHAALGRKGKTKAGCIRLGIEIWKIGEIILFEILNNTAKRIKDKDTGFEFLEP